jgi:hypothetical protein
MRLPGAAVALALALAGCAGVPEPQGAAWPEAKTALILDRTMRVSLADTTATLTVAERAAARELIAAGEIMQALYERQRHPQADFARRYVAANPARRDLADLHRLSSGPIATTLDNKREAFLPVADETPARNVWPVGATKEAIDAFLSANPSRLNDILDPRAVVRTASPAEKQAALDALDRHPAIDVLHPVLRARIAAAETFMAVPYSVAYADEISAVSDHLYRAASLVSGEDPAFAQYLRLRARDLLSDDYEGGDGAWVTMRFKGNLNAQIGSYETYDDALYGVKTFFSLSLLQRDAAETGKLARAIAGVQAIENALPYDTKKRVREDIPVGVYTVIADFGQARGLNTATILPNDADLSRRYGRTILMRGNIIRSPENYAEFSLGAFKAAVDARHHDDLDVDGNLHRTLWHEIGHYLGVERTIDGRDLDAALSDTADALEEMKADLVSLFAARRLHAAGVFSDRELRAIEAAGVRRVLQKSRPRRDQAYQTMQLVQWNWFLDRGLLRFKDGALLIDYRRYPAAVESLLAETLKIQRAGDRAAAGAFFDRWTAWDENLHGAVAARMKAAEKFRFGLVSYGALDCPQGGLCAMNEAGEGEAEEN